MDVLTIGICVLGTIAVIAAFFGLWKFSKYGDDRKRNKSLEETCKKNVDILQDLETLIAQQRAALPAKSKTVVDNYIAVVEAKKV